MHFKTPFNLFIVSGLLFFSACTTPNKDASKSKKDQRIAQANVLTVKKRVPTLSEVISTDVGFTKLYDMAKTTEHINMFEKKGPYTVFALTNGALDRLPPKMLENLKKPENQEELKAILNYHIIPGLINKQDMLKAIKEYDGSVKLKTIGGVRLTATMKGDRIYLIDQKGNAGRLMVNDIEASNGIIHTIESVMMPN